mgnify:CR=1 FL=1
MADMKSKRGSYQTKYPARKGSVMRALGVAALLTGGYGAGKRLRAVHPRLSPVFPAGEQKYTYRLSSLTCLAGDVIGDYSFTHEIQIGDRLVFEDMAIYSMVKNNTFNGIPLPSIAMLREDGEVEMIKQFGYEDFKGRL